MKSASFSFASPTQLSHQPQLSHQLSRFHQPGCINPLVALGRSGFAVMSFGLGWGLSFGLSLPALAEGTLAGTEIRNTAVGSFQDPNDIAAPATTVTSNEVIVTVSEVAGITLSNIGTSEAPSGVSGAGAEQGNGQINGSDIVYFNYVITNVGNDPSQFFIPGSPSDVVNATFDVGLYGPIQITGYDPDGPSGSTAPTDLSSSPVTIPNGGSTTGDLTIQGSSGSFAPNATVNLRIPVKLNNSLAVGNLVEVLLGSTDPAPDNQNQPLDPSGDDRDLTTEDNSGTTNGDKDGAPTNGVREASSNQSVTVSSLAGRANILLVKRITAINGQPVSRDGDNLSLYTDDGTNPYDDNDLDIPGPQTSGGSQPDTTNWPTPSSFLIGGINGGNVRPGDELEYTIYFLSAGELDAQNVLFCDRIPENVTFIPTAFNSGFSADSSGLITSDRGILLNQDGTSLALSNTADGDRGRYFPPNSSLTDIYSQLTHCGTNDNGAVVVDLQTLPRATAPGTPGGASGFVRFRGRVK